MGICNEFRKIWYKKFKVACHSANIWFNKFIKFILDNKTMTDFIRLYPFSPDKFKENEKKVLKYCQKAWDWKICVRVITSIL